MDHATVSLIGGVGLLERAIAYTLGSLQLVTPDALARASPCRGWDLSALLRHLNDSLEVMHEAVDVGHVDLAPTGADDEGRADFDGHGDRDASPAATLRDRACGMLGAWANADDRAWVSVGGFPLTATLVTATGALEIAVHGWDVACACGRPRDIPAALAEELLPLARLLVTDSDRPGRFAAPVYAAPAALAGQRLLAFLGRNPI